MRGNTGRKEPGTERKRGGWTPLRVVFASRRNEEFTVRLSDGLAG